MAPDWRRGSIRRASMLKRGLAVVGVIAVLALLAASSGRAATSWWFLFAANGDLWQTDGDRLVQLTHSGQLAQPTFRSDALVYVERKRNHSDVWLAGPGHSPRQLTHNAAPIISDTHWAAQPVFAPAADRLYVLSDRNKVSTGVGNLAVWAFDLPTATFRQITHPPAYTGGDQDVTVNPRNALQLVFTRYRFDQHGQRVEELDWLDLRVGITVPLTAADRRSRQAQFSPEGDLLAFVATDGQLDDLYVGRIEVGTGQAQLVDVQQVAVGVIAQPVWRPDGQALSYLALTNRQYQLWTVGVGANAGQPHQITHAQALDATSRPVWLSEVEALGIQRWSGDEAN
jgi:Tol biopolymer transport system component